MSKKQDLPYPGSIKQSPFDCDDDHNDDHDEMAEEDHDFQTAIQLSAEETARKRTKFVHHVEGDDVHLEWAISASLEDQASPSPGPKSAARPKRKYSESIPSSIPSPSSAQLPCYEPALSSAFLDSFTLNPAAQLLLDREKRLFASLLSLLESSNASPDDQLHASNALQSLKESLFLLVVCGEFNSGKSSLLNTLLGKEYLKEGVLPTTSQINLIRFGQTKSNHNMDMRADADSVLALNLPVPWLKYISVVDTPGTNAIQREHEELTKNFIPRCDLVMFVTSADRPFPESERVFLERIRSWGKNVIVIINKLDILKNEAQEQQVETFVRDEVLKVLGYEPRIFFVSAHFAGRYKFRTANPAQSPGSGSSSISSSDFVMCKQQSRFETLERYIFHELDSSERVKMKLESKLGVADELLKKYHRHAIQDRLAALKQDEEVLANVENQMAIFKDKSKLNFKAQWVDKLENALLRIQQRATAFFDEELTATNFIALVTQKNEEFQKEFERRVTADPSERMKEMISHVVDWSRKRKLSLWKDVIEYVQRSQPNQQHSGTSNFDSKSQSMKMMMEKVAEDASSSLDKDKEVTRLQTLMSDAVSQTTSVAASGIGLGVLSLACLPAMAAVGVIGASAVVSFAAVAFLALKKKQVKQKFTAELQTLRQRLDDSLMANFEDDLAASLSELDEAMAPYTRFVRSESKRLQKLRVEFERLETEAREIRTDIHLNLNVGSAASSE